MVTGHKADPGVVSKSMRKARNLDGSRIFKKDEFLSSQQISNFSRLAKAKNLDSYETTSEVKLTDHPVDNDVHALVDEVMNAIALQHPIMYDTYNICTMTSQKKLKKFSVAMLNDICNSFELGTSHITKKLKDPYVKLLEEVVSRCSCSA